MAAYDGPTIDCDVHHTWAAQDELVEFLQPRWRRHVEEAGLLVVNPPIASFPHVGGFNKRVDAIPPGGGPPGSSYEMLRRQVLEPNRVRRALLTFDVGHHLAHPNPYYGAELARATNDWSIARWLSLDDERLHGGVLVSSHLPDEAAREIRRVGGHPRIAEVLMIVNSLGLPFGHPLYHPIYDAAQELGLPIALHIGADYFAANTAGGALPESRFEYHTVIAHPVQHHLASFIAHGVFERFPQLKLLLVETGVGWLAPLLWGLDAQYPALRRESDWVKALPSEYFRERVRLTTQPLEMAPRPGALREYLEMLDLREQLCFSTDYPHWDADDLAFVERSLPPGWHRAVFHDNAAAFFGWADLGSHELEGAPELAADSR